MIRIPTEPFNYAAGHTLFSALAAAARQFGSRPGQIEDQKPGSYSCNDLLNITLALGRLSAGTTVSGEHVGVLLPNMAATVGLVIGLSAFGRVPCLLNYTSGSEGLQSACRTAGIRQIITSRQFLEKAGLGEQVAVLYDVRLIFLEELRERLRLVDKVWLLGFARWLPLIAVPPGDPAAAAVVLFTSGSEGMPKGVVLSHRAILSNVEQSLTRLRIGAEDSVFNALPLFHSFGLTAGTILPILAGSRLVLYTSPLHYKAIPGLVREKRSTVLFGTSTFFNHYAANAEPGDFDSLVYVVAGAEKLAGSVRDDWWDRFGIEILEGYGVTEAAPVLAVNHPDSNRPGTVGRLLPGVEALLVPVPDIADGGELHVRGPNLMNGYYLPDRDGLVPPASAAGDGWHNTGDVVSIDEEGFVTIKGRMKRFAKVAGEMVSLEVVEIIARTASSEATHAATCISDPSRGEMIVLFTTDSDLTRDQLAAAARGLGYPEVAIPRRIRVLDAIPLLGTGKIDAARLKSEAEAG